MTNIDIKRVCIHECCHAIIARLFRQKIKIEKVVVNADSVMNGEDNGTLYINGPLLNDEQDHTALAITLFAGVIGENMYLQGADAIRDRKGEIIADNTIIDWLFAGGDISSFRDNAYVFTLFYQIDGDKLKEFCLRFLIDFLSNKEVWSMVEKLCDELLKADDLKLSEEELESAFRQIGLDTLLDNQREECLKQCDEVLQFCQSS
ncbi:MAG: hypothetical protein E6H07_06450 [Bacteroidetes bacterium]|nr:MAG: hypothetical protein E6H07_06450 [Bacteroidota bacterium]